MKLIPSLAACAAIFATVLTASALAQPTCPHGEVLYAAFEKDYSSSNDTRARAILYWQDTGPTAVDHLGKIYNSLSECRKGLCNTGESDYPEMAAYKQFYSDTFKLEKGYSEKQPVYAGFNAPPPMMLTWAENRLGCTAGPTLAERTAAAEPALQMAAATQPTPQPAPQPVAQQSIAPPAPVSACNLTPEELTEPQRFTDRDRTVAVLAWWALKGKQELELITNRMDRDFAAQAFGPWTRTTKKVRQGETNMYGGRYDKKMERAIKKRKPLPLDRVEEYPPHDAMVAATKLFGDCFGERSAALDFEEIGLVRGDFSAEFCNSAAAMPEVKRNHDWAINRWGRAQLEFRYDKACGYIPAIAYEFAMNDETVGAEAAAFAREVAENKQRQYEAAVRGNKMFQKAYEEGAEARAAIAAEKRAKQAEQDRARKEAADAAYNQMITDSRKPPPPPKSNRRDCYDQGDGTEVCYTD